MFKRMELSLILRLIHSRIILSSFVVAKTVKRLISKESFKIYNLSDSVIIKIRKIM